MGRWSDRLNVRGLGGRVGRGLSTLMSRGTGASRSARPSRTGASRVAESARFFESLEARLVFAGTALPSLSDLESPNNTVVRFETSLGDVDIELFDAAAPITVQNFLNYTRTGRFDETFFHRSAWREDPGTVVQPGNQRPSDPSIPRFVVQGGGFAFDERQSPGLRNVTTDAPIIREVTGRSNVERTIAMARTNELTSATSQFFFNMADNSSTLDIGTASGGFTVFGRVIQGWSVVQTISNLNRWNLTNNASFTSNPSAAGAMAEVPVNTGYAGGAVTNSTLVTVVNAEVIKPANFAGFFSQVVASPDGFRSSSATETLKIFNPNTGSAAYQVVARYENGLRDDVISSGTLNAGAHLTIPVSSAADTSLNLVRSRVPYSLYVYSAVGSGVTTPAPLGASFERQDFNAYTAEEGLEVVNLATAPSSDFQTWRFPSVEQANQSRTFIVWQNLSDDPASIVVNFHGSAGQVVGVTFTTDAYRRGGLEVHSLPLLGGGTYSAVVTSSRPILAMLADWDVTTTGAAGASPAWSSFGIAGAARPVGFLPEVQRIPGFNTSISLFNNTEVTSVVTLSFIRPGQPTVDRVQVVFPQSRAEVSLETPGLGVNVGEVYAVRYQTNQIDAPITAGVVSLQFSGRNQPGTPSADGLSTVFSSRVGSSTLLTGGGIADPARFGSTLSETVSVFNPFTTGANGGTFSFNLRYHFNDGTTIDSQTFNPSPLTSTVVRTQDIAAVLAKINSGTQFRNYSISVVGSATGVTGAIGGIAQLTLVDTAIGRAFTTLGTPLGTLRDVNDSIFQTGTGS
ncbi:MAG: peptidylprolyl isomerase [Planctomycetota bacterium]|nr:peptidylprolyl isomerase [Planctomycetota bacterium]